MKTTHNAISRIITKLSIPNIETVNTQIFGRVSRDTNKYLKLFCVLLITAFIHRTSYAQIQSSYRIEANSIHITDTVINNSVYSCIKNQSGLVPNSEISLPQLPGKYISFIIPFGFELDSIEIINLITTEIELQNKILPVQTEQYACIGCAIPPFIPDTSFIYSTDELYPKQIFGDDIIGVFDNCKIISIPFTPFQYNPVKGKLVVTSSVEFTLRLKQMANPNDYRALKKLERYKGMNKNFIIEIIENKSDYDINSLPVTTLQSIDHSNTTVDFFEYTIISTSNFNNKAQRLIDWKRKKGLDAGFVDIADILSDYSGVGDNIGNVLYSNTNTIYDDTAKVRMYLKDAYEQHGTQWVLIVGDEDIVPVRYQYMSSDDFNATDTYYGNFTGDWNVDGDFKYGENGGDKVIGNLELYVGRIPCNSPIEFENWIIKSLLYEQDPGKGSSGYLSRCIGMQGDQLQNSNDYKFFMDATNGFYSHHLFEEKLSSSASGLSLTAPYGSDIISYINNSPPNLWFWFEHGLYNTV